MFWAAEARPDCGRDEISPRARGATRECYCVLFCPFNRSRLSPNRSSKRHFDSRGTSRERGKKKSRSRDTTGNVILTRASASGENTTSSRGDAPPPNTSVALHGRATFAICELLAMRATRLLWHRRAERTRDWWRSVGTRETREKRA